MSDAINAVECLEERLDRLMDEGDASEKSPAELNAIKGLIHQRIKLVDLKLKLTIRPTRRVEVIPDADKPKCLTGKARIAELEAELAALKAK